MTGVGGGGLGVNIFFSDLGLRMAIWWALVYVLIRFCLNFFSKINLYIKNNYSSYTLVVGHLIPEMLEKMLQMLRFSVYFKALCGSVTEVQLHSLKKSAFCLKTSYFMNRSESPGGNFASGAVWHTIVFKVPAFQGGFAFLISKLTDVPIWSLILSSNLITIVIDRTWFL